MIRAFQMIFAPEGVWPKITEKNRHFLFILLFSTLPLICGCLAVEAYGLERLGRRDDLGEVGMVTVPREIILRYAGTHLIGDLVFLFVGSYLLLAVAQSFHAGANYSMAFTTLAIGASPIFLMRALDAAPMVDTWVCWGIGVGLAVRALYHGIAVNLKPEQTKGFGLFVISIFIVGFLSGLAHFISLSVLHGKMGR